MEKTIHSQPELDIFAREELTVITDMAMAKNDHAFILGLSGELGAGKTAFTKSLGRELQVSGSIPSPTFVIARFYDIPLHRQFSRLVHIDAYRIEDEEELRPIGWEKIIADPRNLVVVEWPERIPEAMRIASRILSFTVINETTRVIRA